MLLPVTVLVDTTTHSVIVTEVVNINYHSVEPAGVYSLLRGVTVRVATSVELYAG